jgi:hypothetical protein
MVVDRALNGGEFLQDLHPSKPLRGSLDEAERGGLVAGLDDLGFQHLALVMYIITTRRITSGDESK